MSLLVKLSLVDPIKKDLFIRAHLIMMVERANDNTLLTVVSTSIMTNKGPVQFKCFDSPETISEAVNRALMAVADNTSQ